MSASSVMAVDSMCDVSHSQHVIHHGWKKYALRCDAPHMADVFDMAVVRARIAERMKQLKTNQRRVAMNAGLGQTAIRDILKYETSDVKASTLIKIADVLETTVDDLTGLDPVLLAGKVGAGGSILFEEYDEPQEVPRPPLAKGRLLALQVDGDSMLPRYDAGDIIYIRRDHEGVLPEYVGYHCAVHTADGGTFLKILENGTEPGRYTLLSHNAPPMRNVEVVWASPVLFVLPKRPAAQNM
jgi:phage repressor protein C with HTH and peptisase S24 domain